MCLAVPLRLVEINGLVGIGEMYGVRRNVNLNLVENPKVGDHVIVHAGFAIAIMDEQEADETLALLEEFREDEDEG